MWQTTFKKNRVKYFNRQKCKVTVTDMQRKAELQAVINMFYNTDEHLYYHPTISN